MSKHIGRKQRWAAQGPKQYASDLGQVVYQQDAWYALFEYKTAVPTSLAGGPPAWEEHHARLGPFRRPRNAMVALEREAAFLRNRHAGRLLWGAQLWAEAEHHR